MGQIEQLEITRATARDAGPMRECVRAAYRQYVERLGKEPGPMIDDYASRIRDNDAYVMRSGQRLAGILVLVFDDDHCLLDNVAVHPDFTGRGLGKQLVKYAEDQARLAGIPALELYTHELMKENIDMYRKWGYQETRRIREKGFDRVYMKKMLC